MRSGWRGLLALLLLVAPLVPAQAQNRSAPAPAASPAIPLQDASDTQDQQIAERIRSIYAQIGALSGVTVSVRSGVVTLAGSAASADVGDRAESIASRVTGVVTVQNDIARDLAVDQNLSPALGEFGSKLEAILHALPLIGVAIVIALLVGLFGHVVAGRRRFWRWIAPNMFLADLLQTSVRFVFIILGLVAGLEILGATALLGAVLGGAGVIGIALGFAVRDTADNYLSSLMLSLRQPFRASDHVVIDGHEGRVLRLTSRATILMTLDGNHLRIPNSAVFKAVILNYSRNPERRFEFDLGIGADNDPLDGMKVGLRAIDALDFVLDDPRATALIQEVGDSNIVLRFHGWVNQSRTGFAKGRSLAIQAAKAALEDAGFALPEPIYRVRFDDDQVPAFDRAGQAGPTPKPAPAPRSKPTGEAGADTDPDTHIERLVAEERADAPGDDLLDAKRPVE